MTKKCVGCGAVLQSDNENEIGYVPKNKMNDASYCVRCYKIKYYNQKSVTNLENINEKILSRVNKKNTFVYFLIDFLNISQEVVDIYNKIKANKCFVISKVDMIPSSVNKNKVIDNIRNIYGIKEEIVCLSAIKNINTKSIIWRLNDNNIKEAYVVGFANSGKSSLINLICKSFNIKNEGITTSSMPNTTIDFIKMKINDITLYDSPGFVMNNYFYDANDFALIKKCSPKPPLNCRVYQLKDNASIIIEDKIRLGCNIKNDIVLYISNNIDTRRVFDNNIELLDIEKIELDIPDNSDLIIKGLGFINIKKKCKLIINSSKKDLFEVRESIFR